MSVAMDIGFPFLTSQRPLGPSVIRAKELEEEVRRLRSGVLCSLSQLLELRHNDAGRHGARLATWAARVAMDLGMDGSAQRAVEAASLLRDVGKLALPDRILRHKGELRPQEKQLVQKHPEHGWKLLRLLPGFELAGLFVLHHHERYDGKGYPAGLAGDEIPLGARIVAVVDGLEALISSRAYRQPLELEEALGRLVSAGGTQYDPGVVRRFADLARTEFISPAFALPSSLPPA